MGFFDDNPYQDNQPAPAAAASGGGDAQSVAAALASQLGSKFDADAQQQLEYRLSRGQSPEEAAARALEDAKVRFPDTSQNGGGQQMTSGSVGAGGSGGPMPIQAFGKQFALPTQEEVEATPGFKTIMGKGLQALERRASAAGRAGAGLGKEELEYATDFANTFYGDAANRAMQVFGLNRDTFYTDEGNRYNSQRTNRIDDQNILDSNRNYGLASKAQDFGFGQALWGRGNTEQQQNRGFLLDAAQLGNPLNAYNVSSRFTSNAGDAQTDGANAVAAGQVASGNAYSNAIGGAIPIAQNAVLARYSRPTPSTTSYYSDIE